MFHVDNSGKGNCMYYAYGISLMYYLRAKNAPDITENVFNKLKLKEEDKVRLRELLSKNPNHPFTSREIKTVIEPILGKATRDLAAEYTKQEFKISPHDTPLFSSAKYGLEFCFKQSLLANGSELSVLIGHGFTNPDFTDAEIYKMGGTDLAMTEYSLLRIPHVIEEFNRLWAIKEEAFKKEEKQLTPGEIKTQQEKLLDNILRDETVNFFLSDDEKYLNLYRDHLQKEYVWAAEETLLVLHRAIQGERMIRNQKGTMDTLYDTEIVLHLYRNGSTPFYQSRSPEMILNNQSNMHWTSIIPDSLFATKLTAHEQKLFEILDDMRMMHSKTPILSEEDGVDHDWFSLLIKQVEILLANPTYAVRAKAIEAVFQLMGKVILKLGVDPSWRPLLSSFLSTFVDCIPIFLANKPMSPDLKQAKHDLAEHSQESKELFPKDSSDKESSAKQAQIGTLSKFSNHTLFKKSEKPLQKTYPGAIARYVSEAKQTGPRVAKAIRQMYQEGLEGDETYSPEKCREIAVRYVHYVKYKQRHFVLTDVNHFIKEMDEIIKQKEDNLEKDVEPMDAIERNTSRDVSITLR